MPKNNKNNFKYAICYIPLIAIFLFFIEKNANDEYKKHIKYWVMLFVLYVVTTTILNVLWLWWLNWFVVLAYIIISLYLWYKTYNWEKVDVEILNDISEKIENKK